MVMGNLLCMQVARLGNLLYTPTRTDKVHFLPPYPPFIPACHVTSKHTNILMYKVKES